MTPELPDGGRLSAEARSSAEAAERRLRSSPYLALKTVRCEYREGVLTLLGHLPSYYLKQRAQALFTSMEGIQRIDNRIEVVPITLEVSPPEGQGENGLAPGRPIPSEPEEAGKPS